MSRFHRASGTGRGQCDRRPAGAATPRILGGKVAALSARYCQGEAAPISVAIVHQYAASVSDWEPSIVAEDVAIEETVGNCGPTNTGCGGFEGTFCPARTHSSGRIAAEEEH